MERTTTQRHAIDRSSGCTTIALYGDFDLASRHDARRLLLAEVSHPGAETLALDLSGVTFMDSSALSILVAALHQAQRLDRRFYLTDASPRVRKVLQITGLLDLLTAARPVS